MEALHALFLTFFQIYVLIHLLFCVIVFCFFLYCSSILANALILSIILLHSWLTLGVGLFALILLFLRFPAVPEPDLQVSCPVFCFLPYRVDPFLQDALCLETGNFILKILLGFIVERGKTAVKGFVQVFKRFGCISLFKIIA